MLYDEGWFIVTSSRQRADVCQGHIRSFLPRKPFDFSASMPPIAQPTTPAIFHPMPGTPFGTGKALAEGGTGLTGQIFRGTGSLAKTEAAYARATFINGWDKFIQGNLSLQPRTAKDRQELMALPGDTFASLREDFSNLWELTQAMHDTVAGKIHVSWEAAFQQASREFRAEYERSGEQHNTSVGDGADSSVDTSKHSTAGRPSQPPRTLVRTAASGTAYRDRRRLSSPSHPRPSWRDAPCKPPG